MIDFMSLYSGLTHVRFFYMLTALSYNASHMVIFNLIKDIFSFPVSPNQAIHTQDMKMMRNSRLGYIEFICDITDASLGNPNLEQNFNPGRIAQGFEKLCQIFQLLSLWFMGPDLIHK